MPVNVKFQTHRHSLCRSLGDLQTNPSSSGNLNGTPYTVYMYLVDDKFGRFLYGFYNEITKGIFADALISFS